MACQELVYIDKIWLPRQTGIWSTFSRWARHTWVFLWSLPHLSPLGLSDIQVAESQAALSQCCAHECRAKALSPFCSHWHLHALKWWVKASAHLSWLHRSCAQPKFTFVCIGFLITVTSFDPTVKLQWRGANGDEQILQREVKRRSCEWFCVKN